MNLVTNLQKVGLSTTWVQLKYNLSTIVLSNDMEEQPL